MAITGILSLWLCGACITGCVHEVVAVLFQAGILPMSLISTMAFAQ